MNPHMKLGLIALLAIGAVQSAAQALPPPNLLVKAEAIPPTRADVPYGDQPRQVLDFWQAQSDRPTPLVFYVPGGLSWLGNSTKMGGASLLANS